MDNIKKFAAGRTLDVNAVDACIAPALKGSGYSFTVNKKGSSVDYEISECPFYDGLKACGFSHLQIGQLCEAMNNRRQEAIQSLMPGTIWKVDFRGKPDGCCTESFQFC